MLRMTNLPSIFHILNAFALDLFGFGVSTFPPGVAGALSFHDPLEGTEINLPAARERG
jgi:hypothetical protein